MTEAHVHAPEHEAPKPALRFESFADAPSARDAFEAIYPLGSSLEPALKALTDMGAHCKSVGPTRIACRYVETERGLAGWCWHVVIEGSAEGTLERVGVARAALGV